MHTSCTSLVVVSDCRYLKLSVVTKIRRSTWQSEQAWQRWTSSPPPYHRLSTYTTVKCATTVAICFSLQSFTGQRSGNAQSLLEGKVGQWKVVQAAICDVPAVLCHLWWIQCGKKAEHGTPQWWTPTMPASLLKKCRTPLSTLFKDKNSVFETEQFKN